MTRSYPKASQIATDGALETLGVSAETPLNDLFTKLAQEVEHPYRLHAAAVPDTKLYVTASSNQTAAGISEVAGVSVAAVTVFESGYIDFQARAFSANINITFPESTVGFYRLCVISALRDGTLKANFTAENADLNSLPDPRTVMEVGGKFLGWIQLQCTNAVGQFKTANSATAIIENKVGSESRVFEYSDLAVRSIVAARNPSETTTDGFIGQLLQQSDTAQLWIKQDGSASSFWKPLDWSNIITNYSGWAVTTGITLSLIGTNKETLQITGTRTFYVRGRPFKKTTTETATMSGSKGVRFFFYDSSGTLQVSTSVYDYKNAAPVAVAYWNGTSAHSLAWELHGLTDADDHYWKHITVGTRYVSGLQQTSSPLPSGNPIGNTESYIWLTGGRILDEDIKADIVSTASPSQKWDQNLGSGLTNTTAAVLPFLYIDSSNTAVYVPPNSDRFPFLYSSANGTPQYSNAGVLTNVSSGSYAVYWVCATTTQVTSDANFGTVGTAVYLRPHVAQFSTLALARAASFGELNWADISVQENKILYQIIFECSTGFTNATHRCKITEVNDLRASSPVPVGQAASASSHLLLSNLNGGQYGDGNHANLVVGKVTSSSLPTITDDSAAHKTGTLWIDAAAKRGFILLNNLAGAADWRELAYAGGNDTALTLGTNGAHGLTFETNGTEAGVVDTTQAWNIGPAAGNVTHVIRGNLTVNGSVTFLGDPTVISSGTLLVTDNQIVVNNGEVGAGVTAGKAGMLVDRGTETDYEFIFQEASDTFRVGLVNATQAVATREDTPTSFGVAYWNAGQYRFDTDAEMTYDAFNNRLSSKYVQVTSDGGVEFGNATNVFMLSGTHLLLKMNSVTLLDVYNGNTLTLGAASAGKVEVQNGLLEIKGRSGQDPTYRLIAISSTEYYEFQHTDATTNDFTLKSYDGSAVQDHLLISDHAVFTIGRNGNYVHQIGGTGALRVPSGTTTNRDALTAVAGSVRFNTTGSVLEYYSGSAWSNVASEAYASQKAAALAIVLG